LEAPDAFKGDDTGSRLVKVIGRIAELRCRLADVENELAEQRQHELYELMMAIMETEAMGDDALVQKINAANFRAQN
jgi:uncharacterized membrane protein YqjE